MAKLPRLATAIMVAMAAVLLPLAYAFVIDLAYASRAISKGSYEDLGLPIYGCLMAPGDILLGLFGIDLAFPNTHAKGAVFWWHLTLQMGANCLGWLILVAVTRYTFAWTTAVVIKRMGTRDRE
jgi:hypothetical protein